MRMGSGHAPAYNVQTPSMWARDIVAHQVTTEGNDQRSLLPMAESANRRSGILLGCTWSPMPATPTGNKQKPASSKASAACACQSGVNNQGDGTLFDRSEFHYDEDTDTFRCPANQTLMRKQLSRKDRAVYYAGRPEVCGACALKGRCTMGKQRLVSRHLHDEALQRMQQRATPEMMRLRRSTVEHPFASLKYHIFGHPRSSYAACREPRRRSAWRRWSST